MDRNSYIGLGLIFVILIGYFYINKPNDAELAVQKRYADSIQNVKVLTEKKAELDKIKKEQEKDSIKKLLLTDTNALKRLRSSHATM